VQGYRRALIYDDEISTGSSVVSLCNLLIDNGIEEIAVICTHGLFIGNALERLAAIPQITEIVTTNTVPIPMEKRQSCLKVISIAPVFGEAIWRNYTRQSIADLYTFGDENR
jgi:ribose-phosphate pyrophosphokinase